MKLRATLAVVVAATIVLVPFLVASGQQAERFPGTDLPITIRPADLTADYRPLKLKEQSSGILGDYYSSSYFQFGSLGIRSTEENSNLRDLIEILPVAWTRNELVKVYGQDFVVTYILEPEIEKLQAVAQGKPLDVTHLKLKLMKADQIGSIEPFPELDKEKYLAILQRLTTHSQAVATSSMRTAALSNAKQLALGVIMYMSDYDDIIPYVQSTKTLARVTEPYVKNRELWKPLNPKGGQLRLNMSISGTLVTTIESPAETPLLYDPIAWPDGTFLVAYADGHARFEQPDRWNRVQKNLHLKLKRHGKPIK